MATTSQLTSRFAIFTDHRRRKIKLENCIFKFKIDYDKEQLAKESKLYHYKPINTETLNNIYNVSESDNDDLSFIQKDETWWKDQESWNTGYKLKEDNVNDLPESERLTNLFKRIVGTEHIKPNFFTQTKGTEVKTHIDVGTLCAINFMIRGGETPVRFDDADSVVVEKYTVALLDVSRNHSVPIQTGEDRLLFKLRFTHNKYEEVKEAIKQYQLDWMMA